MIDAAGIYANDPLMRAAVLRMDVEHFLDHDKVGQYLLMCAVETRAQALEDLGQVDPTDTKAIMELQWAAKVPDMFQAWLNHAIAAGKNAEETIRIEESIDNE